MYLLPKPVPLQGPPNNLCVFSCHDVFTVKGMKIEAILPSTPISSPLHESQRDPGKKSKSTHILYSKPFLVLHFTHNKKQLSDTGQKVQPKLKHLISQCLLCLLFSLLLHLHSFYYSSNTTMSFPRRGPSHCPSESQRKYPFNNCN